MQYSLKNIAKILDFHCNISDDLNEYNNLMKILKKEEINLLELLEVDDENYSCYLNVICEKAKNNNISDLLTIIRKIQK